MAINANLTLAPLSVVAGQSIQYDLTTAAQARGIVAGGIITEAWTGIPDGVFATGTYADFGVINGTIATTATGSHTLTGTVTVWNTTNGLIADAFYVCSTVITVIPQIAIRSALTASAVVGVFFSYQLLTNIPAVGVGVGALPAGLTWNAALRLISGTPQVQTTAGTHIYVVADAAGANRDDELLVLTIAPAPPRPGISPQTGGTLAVRPGQTFTITPYATCSPTSWAATATLPTGVSVNTSTGVISGSIATPGTYTIYLIASNAAGAGLRGGFSVHVLAPSPIEFTSDMSISAAQGEHVNAYIATSPYGAITVGSLPSWLTWDNASHTFTGNAPQAATAVTYRVDISAVSGEGAITPTGSQFVIAVSGPPSIAFQVTSNQVQAIVLQRTDFALKTNIEAATMTGTGLPTGAGVTKDPITKAWTLTWVPQSATINPAIVTLTATSLLGSTATLTLTLTATAAPSPTIVWRGAGSPFTFALTTGVAWSYQLSTDIAATGFSDDGLPTGFAVSGRGLLTGTGAAAGTLNGSVNAIGASGNGPAQQLVFNVTDLHGSIASPLTASGRIGNAFSYQTIANPVGSAFTATGLPGGLSINATTGLISGTPSDADTAQDYPVTVSCTTANGTATDTVVLTLAPAATPQITSARTTAGRVSEAFSLALTSDTAGAVFVLTDGPSWLSLGLDGITLSGTPTVEGTVYASVTASAHGVTGTARIEIDVAGTGVSNVTSAFVVTVTAGGAFTYTLTGDNSPTGYAVGPLPSWLTWDSGTQQLTGTAPSTAGTWTVAVSVVNIGGTRTKPLQIHVASVTSRDLSVSGNTISAGNLGADLIMDVVTRQVTSLLSTAPDALFFARSGEEILINLFFKKDHFLQDVFVTSVEMDMQATVDSPWLPATLQWVAQATDVAGFISLKAVIDQVTASALGIGGATILGRLTVGIAVPWAGGTETVSWTSEPFTGMVL